MLFSLMCRSKFDLRIQTSITCLTECELCRCMTVVVYAGVYTLNDFRVFLWHPQCLTAEITAAAICQNTAIFCVTRVCFSDTLQCLSAGV